MGELRTMWTVQPPVVWESIQRDGRSVVKKQYLRKKYGDMLWIFETAYGFLGKEMEKRLGRPKGAESPIWVYEDLRYPHGEVGADLLELQIPEEELMLFDSRDWERILNLAYLGTEEEQSAFQGELRRQGVKDSAELFHKPFYPTLRRRVTESWQRLFREAERDAFYTMGAVWELKQEWVRSVRKCNGNP